MKKCEEEVSVKIPKNYKSIFKIAEVRPFIYKKIIDFLEKCPEKIIDALDREEYKVKAKNKYGIWQLGFGERNEVVIYRDVVSEKINTPGDSSLHLGVTDDRLFEMDFPTQEEYEDGDVCVDDLDQGTLFLFSETRFNLISNKEVTTIKDYYQLYTIRVTRNLFLGGYEGNILKEDEMTPVEVILENHPYYIERKK